ncbi:AAA family ATPase [Desulfarculales bacterium]
MHTITQFQGDSKPILPVILAGQNNLAGLLLYRISLPLASRVVARSHLAGVSLQDMQAYSYTTSRSQASNRNYSLIRPSPPYSRTSAAFFEEPTTWLEARSVIAAVEEQAQVVSTEHVRIPATELI